MLGATDRGTPKSMTRKLLLLPAIAAALLAGCATYGYGYRGGAGDYYYGQPGTEYRYYGYPGGYYGGYGYPGYYGSPYWGGSIGYYRYYVPSGHWNHGGSHHHGGDHDGDHDGDHRPPPPPPPAQDHPDRPRPPWRDLGNVARPHAATKLPPPIESREAATPRMRRPAPSLAPDDAMPRFPRVGGRKRDAHPTPVP